MTKNLQTKLIFPAPDPSYSTTTSMNQVIYLPRDLMKRAINLKPHPLLNAKKPANKKEQ